MLNKLRALILKIDEAQEAFEEARKSPRLLAGALLSLFKARAELESFVRTAIDARDTHEAEERGG